MVCDLRRGLWVVQIRGKGRGRVGRVYSAQSKNVVDVKFSKESAVEILPAKFIRLADPHEMPASGYFKMEVA